VSESTRRALWDEIAEIAQLPDERGAVVAESDPEFRGMRIGLGVAGYAIFYVHYPAAQEVYVVTIRPWEYPNLS
jgi:hypothetical protein